jgi:hypothetical protein
MHAHTCMDFTPWTLSDGPGHQPEMESSPSGPHVAARGVGDPWELSWGQTVQSGPTSWGLKTDRGTCCVWVGAAQVRHMGLLSCKVQVIDHTQRSHKHVGWPGQKCCPGDLVWAQTWQFAGSPQCVHGHGVHLGMLPTQNSGPQPPLPDHTPQA